MSRARTERRHGTASSYSSHSLGFGGRPRFSRGPRLDRRFLGFDLGRNVIDAPAMATGVTKRLWEMGNIVDVLEAWKTTAKR